MQQAPERKAPKGKFRILGIDKFEPPGEGHWIKGDYASKEKALRIARKKTHKASKNADDPSIATVYYVYDDEGNYLGGNIYEDE